MSLYGVHRVISVAVVLFMHLIFILLLTVFNCNHHPYAKETGEKTPCNCTATDLASQKRILATVKSEDQTALTSAFRPPLGGSFVCCSTAVLQPSSRYDDEASLEMFEVQEIGQANRRILPKLWWTLGLCAGRFLQSAAAISSLGLGCVGEHFVTEFKDEIRFETKVGLTYKRWQIWQGWQKSEEDGNASCCAKSICALSCSTTSGTMACSRFSKQYSAGLGFYGFSTGSSELGADQCPQKGIPRRSSSGGAGGDRQNLRHNSTPIDERPAFSYDCSGASKEILQRRSGSGNCPPSGMAQASQRSHQAVGGPTRPIPQKAVAVSGSQDQSRSGSRSSQKDDSVSELTDHCKWYNGPHGGFRRCQARSWRSTGRRGLETVPPKCSHCLCRSHRSSSEKGGRDPDPFRWRRSRTTAQTFKGRSWRWCTYLVMIWGRGLTCPDGIANRPWPLSSMPCQDVEAYSSSRKDTTRGNHETSCFCAASIQWQHTARSCGMQVGLYDLFSQTWAAQRSATHLRGEIALSACSSATFLSTPRPIPQRRTSNTWKPRFGASIELHIFEDYDCSMAPPVVLGIDALCQWQEKPWALRKNNSIGVSCRDRIPWLDLPSVELLPKVEVSMVENDYPKPLSWIDQCTTASTEDDDASIAPLLVASGRYFHAGCSASSTLSQHRLLDDHLARCAISEDVFEAETEELFAQECVASSGHPQRGKSLVGDPPINAHNADTITEASDGQRHEVHLRREDLSLPLTYTFASAPDAADQDQVITSFRGDSITMISFGHKLHYLEQRTMQLGVQDFHRWRECLRTLWADFDDGTFFAIHNIIPPPVLGRSTVSTIIQLAPISVHASLVLLQFVPSSTPPEDPFAEIIPATSMKRNVFQACGQHLVMEPTAIVKQGFKVWHTGVPQHVQSGAFLRILIDDFPDDAVSLTQSFATDISLVGAPLIETARLLGEHRLSRIEPAQDQQEQNPAAGRLPPQGPAGTTRLYPWHMWEHFFNNPQEQGDHGVSLTIYGLALEPIETTFAEMRELSRTQLFRTVRSMYPAYSTWNLRIHMVCPQPVDAIRRTHILAEFLPQGHAGLGNLCPVVTEVRWYQHTGLRHEMRAALYRPTPTACNLLLDDLEPRCLPRGDQHCSIWSRGLPCVVDQTITLHRGDFIQIRLMPEWSSDISTGNFLGSEDFYRYGLTVTHWSSTGEIPLHFLTVDGQQHDSALSSFDTLTIDTISRRAEDIWGPHALATFVRDRSDITGGWYFVISDLHTDGVPLLVDRRIRDANGRTFHQFSALIWHSEQTLRQLIHDNFDASWSHDSDNRFVFVNQSPLPQDQLDLDFHPTPGTLVTVYHTAEEVTPLAFPVSYEEDRDDPIEDDEQFLLQRTVFSVGQLQVEGNSVSGTLLSSIDECVQCRPNGDILPDPDSRIRYQFQLRNGERVSGIIVAPPNWDRQPALLYAADHGTVRRDASQQLLVYVRSWFLPHDRYGSRLSKDCTIPAQLLFRLLDRLRNVWRQELLPNDVLQLRVVSPTPAAMPNEHPRLHVILECNRPRTSLRRAILLTFQDLQPDGPSPVITWIPFLAPPMITLQIIADVAVQPCDSRHLIVLAGTPDRRWMTEQDAREVQHGLYLSVLRDVRRRFPTQRLEIEETSMMQSLSTRGSSRSPRRSEGITPSSTHSSSSTFLVHAFRMSREHRLLTFDRTSDRSYAEQLTATWEVPVHQAVIELHTVNSPPQDLELSADSTFLVEFTADRQRQADPSDRLVLVDVTFTSADSLSTAANLRRTLWARHFMSREDVLHLLASSNLCRLSTISCTVHLNHRTWPPDDTAHRQLMHGDYLHLVVTGPAGVPSSHVQLVACERESADSQRYIYRPSPSPSPDRPTPVIEQAESDAEEDDDDVSVSLLQKTASLQRAQATCTERHPDKPVRTPLGEITNILLPLAPLGPHHQQVNRTRETLLTFPMSLTAGVQVILSFACPIALFLLDASHWVTQSQHLLKLSCRVRIYNLFGTSCYNSTSALQARFLSLLNGIPPLKWPLKLPQLGLMSCRSVMNFTLTGRLLFWTPPAVVPQQLSLLSTPFQVLVLEGRTAFMLMTQRLHHEQKSWPCWELFYGPLNWQADILLLHRISILALTTP